MAVVFERGQLDVTVASGEKIAVLSQDVVELQYKTGYPNHPDTWALLARTTAGTEYTSSAMSADTVVRILPGADKAYYETGAAPVTSEPYGNITASGATFTIAGLAAAQGGYVKAVGGTSATSANAGGAVQLLGGVPGATGAGGAITIAGGAGGATSGAGGQTTITGGAAATDGNGGSVVLTAGAAAGSGVGGHVVTRSLLVKSQGAPNAQTTTATLTIANLLTGIVTGTHTAGATQTYTLPTGTLVDAALQFSANDSFDWSLINLSAAAVDTVTVAAGADHTIVGNPIVQSAHASTGGVYGNSSLWRTRKTAANTYVTYRIA